MSRIRRVTIGAESAAFNRQECWFSLNKPITLKLPHTSFTQPPLLTAYLGWGIPTGPHPTRMCPLAVWPLTPSRGGSHSLGQVARCSEGHHLHPAWPWTLYDASLSPMNTHITFDASARQSFSVNAFLTSPKFWFSTPGSLQHRHFHSSWSSNALDRLGTGALTAQHWHFNFLP